MGKPDASVDAGPPPDAGFEEELDAGRLRFDGGTPDAGFTSASAATWCRSRATALCARNIRCLSSSEPGFAGCVALETAECDQLSFTAGVDAGRLGFNERQAITCLNEYGQGSCTREPPSCASVFTGRVPTDGGCVTNQECNPDSYCDRSTGTCPYRCSAFGTLGAACDFFRRCDPGLGCYRIPDGGFQERCQPIKPADAGCADFDECGENGACIRGACIARQAEPGQPCGVVNGYPFCGDEYFCRQDPPAMMGDDPPPGTCQRRAGLNGTCVGAATCLPTLRCSTVITTGTCLARARRGERCSYYNDCEEGLFCSNTSQRCEPFPTDGGDCSFTLGSAGRCQPGFFCLFVSSDERVCSPRRAPGAECSYDDMCLSNDCEFGRRPDGGFGQTCAVSCALKADAGL
jgi:hypothetical protein